MVVWSTLRFGSVAKERLQLGLQFARAAVLLAASKACIVARSTPNVSRNWRVAAEVEHERGTRERDVVGSNAAATKRSRTLLSTPQVIGSRSPRAAAASRPS